MPYLTKQFKFCAAHKYRNEKWSKDKNYQVMSEDFENSVSFNAALDLILEGTKRPSGYTEPILHSKRILLKNSSS